MFYDIQNTKRVFKIQDEKLRADKMKIIKEISLGFTIERLFSEDVLTYMENKVVCPIPIMIDEEIRINSVFLDIIQSSEHKIPPLEGKTIYYCNFNNDKCIDTMDNVDNIHYDLTQRLWFDSYFDIVASLKLQNDIYKFLANGIGFLVFDDNIKYAKWKMRN